MCVLAGPTVTLIITYGRSFLLTFGTNTIKNGDKYNHNMCQLRFFESINIHFDTKIIQIGQFFNVLGSKLTAILKVAAILSTVLNFCVASELLYESWLL